MAVFYDTHAHLDYPDFASELPQVIERAHAAGIEKILCVGTSVQSSRGAIRIAEQFAGVYAVVGWHPTDVLHAPDDVKTPLRELAVHPKVVGIGETGLDWYRLPSKKGGTASDDDRYKKKQLSVFVQQLELAFELGLNCVVHQRECFEPTIEAMRPFIGKVRGVFHCFAGTPEEVQRVLAAGSIVSFTGILTFKNGQNIREALAATPMDGFMLETDCPFLAPMPYRGKRCEPAYVRETAQVAAEVKGCSLDELSASTCRTAEQFFKKLSR